MATLFSPAKSAEVAPTAGAHLCNRLTRAVQEVTRMAAQLILVQEALGHKAESAAAESSGPRIGGPL